MRSHAESLTRAVALATTAGLLLGSCSTGDGTTGDANASTSPSPTSRVSVPAEVSVTDQGSALSFGEPASVVFEPDQKRGTVLELRVDNARTGSTKDFSAFILDDATKASRPYYVKVTVRNVGTGAVGGAAVPLWGVDAKDTLLPAARFTTSFSTCESDPLPARFAAGDSISTCLVFLAPDKGTLQGVSFRPDQEFDPIQWTGQITTPQPKPKPQPKKTQKPKKKQKN